MHGFFHCRDGSERWGVVLLSGRVLGWHRAVDAVRIGPIRFLRMAHETKQRRSCHDYTGFAGIALWGAIASLLVLVLLDAPGHAQGGLPTILMLDRQPAGPEEAGLYKAIRAQLSAMPLILDRVRITDGSEEPLGSAPGLAAKNNVSMVFWIEEGATSEVFFFIPDANGGRVSSRALDLHLGGGSSRYEVIAIAVASMVEGLLATEQIRPAPAPSPPRAVPASLPLQDTSLEQHRFEIFAGYSGALFAKGLVTHGAKLGVGFLPIRHLAIAASFAHSLPFDVVTEELRLTIISRTVEVSLAGRMVWRAVDLRLGASWSIDLRSHSTQVQGRDLAPFPEEVNPVNAITPFLSAAWILTERLGITARAGAALAVDDTGYEISRIDESDEVHNEEVLRPFVAKLVYQIGIIIHI